MGHQIIKQPSGKYAIWSSIADQFCALGGTEEEIIDLFSDESEKLEIKHIIKLLDNGEKPYFQFTKSWEKALAWIFCQHAFEMEKKDGLLGMLRLQLGENIFPEDVVCISDPGSEFWKEVHSFYRDRMNEIYMNANIDRMR